MEGVVSFGPDQESNHRLCVCNRAPLAVAPLTATVSLCQHIVRTAFVHKDLCSHGAVNLASNMPPHTSIIKLTMVSEMLDPSAQNGVDMNPSESLSRLVLSRNTFDPDRRRIRAVTDEESAARRIVRKLRFPMPHPLRYRLVVVGEASNETLLRVPLRCPQPPLSDITRDHRTLEFSFHLVPDIEKILNVGYYWGPLNRYQAEDLLEGKPEGTFILRDSTQAGYLFSVSFRRYQRTLHAEIEQQNHRFSFDFRDQRVCSASAITELIEQYSDRETPLFFEPKLTHPLHRRHVFSLQELCRGVIISHTTYTGVDSLSIPPILKTYIRKYRYTVVAGATFQE